MTTAPEAGMFGEMAKLGAMYNGALTLLGIDLGHQSGLFEAMAQTGAAASEAIASAAGLAERPVREWLGLMTVSGIVDHDPATGKYSLRPTLASILTGPGMNVGALAGQIAINANLMPLVLRSMRDGCGIAYDELPHFVGRKAEMSRRRYDGVLITGYLDVVPGLVDRLGAGASVADLGCGSGHVANLIGQAFPSSSVVGFDFAEEAITVARKEAAEWGLSNVAFQVCDVATLPPDARFDIVVSFDAIHDQARPREVLAQARRALADDGVFVMVEPAISSRLEEASHHPMAPFIFGASLFHCLQVSLAQGGEGLGTAYGHQVAKALLREAGFADVQLFAPASMDAFNGIFVARVRPRALEPSMDRVRQGSALELASNQ